MYSFKSILLRVEPQTNQKANYGLQNTIIYCQNEQVTNIQQSRPAKEGQGPETCINHIHLWLCCAVCCWCSVY